MPLSEGPGAGHASTETRAALGIAAVLFLATLLDPAPRPWACPDPRGAGPPAGGVVEVVCRSGAEGRPALAGPARLLFGRTLDANQAAGNWLEALPGIGPVRAEAWVRERERSPFCRFADLERIPGVGPRTLAGLAGLVSVKPGSGCSAQAHPPTP